MAPPVSDSRQQHAVDGLGFTAMPSSEYEVIFRDGTVSKLAVHPEDSLRGNLAGMLDAAGAVATDVARVEHRRVYDADAEPVPTSQHAHVREQHA
jgi:hypothetical protein